MDANNELLGKQHFWKTLFETQKLTSKLPILATNHPNGVFYKLPQYGQVLVKAETASVMGDNFMSDTFIVKAYVAPKSPEIGAIIHKTFIKVLPTNQLMRQAANEWHPHDREINMYHQFFGLLRKLNVDNLIPLDVPDVYYTHKEEAVEGETDGSDTCILLEDLKDKGYVMSDKLGGADYRHCHLALTSLAHYHALTLAALRKWTDPTTGDCSKIPPEASFILEKTMYDMGSYQMLKDWAVGLITFTHDIDRRDLGDWLNEIVDRLEECMPVENLETCGPLACLLHGDFWNNNMLFKYASPDPNSLKEESKPVPVAIKLVDFQISRIGHPISDILYFMYTSAMPDVREKHMEELFRQYFDTLMNDTRLLGVHINDYTFEDFMDDYKKRSLGWMFMGAMVMTMVLNKEIVKNLQDQDKEKLLQKPNSDVEPEKGLTGMPSEMEEFMKNTATSIKPSDSPILSNRLLRLILEVKALNNA